MTEIRWKNGGPLFLQPIPGSEFGLVATDQDCCCPPPPPPRCWDCLDSCSYFIEVTAPGALAVKSPPLNCGGPPGFCSQTTTGYLLSVEVPPKYTDQAFAESSSQACSVPNAAPVILSARCFHYVIRLPAQRTELDEIILVASIDVSVLCLTGSTPTPFAVDIESSVSVFWPFSSVPGFGLSEWRASGRFDLPSTCFVAPNRNCSNYAGQFRLLDTPVEFTANGTDTSLGAYQATFSQSTGSLAAEVEAIREDIRGQLTGTFRITSRPSCQTVECSCNSLSIYGTAWTFSQGGLTREYAWGDEQAEWGGSPYYIYWDGVGTFYLTRYDPDSYVTGIGGLMTEFHVVEFSCSTINGVPTWTATITSECFQYDNVPNQTHHSTDTWVGIIECYEACPDEWHGDGAPIPIGELVDVEYLGRTTEPGYSACDPPARVTVSGRQVIAPC